MWNAFMTKDAKYSNNDIPICPTTAAALPISMVTWTEAKAIHKQLLRKDANYHYPGFVNFYEDDSKFDSYKGIWHDWKFVLRVLRHFDGAIAPDFSTYQDFPEPLKLWNTFRMRAYGYWLGCCGIPIINNVRWGTQESYRYCFDGIPKNSTVCIGTVGGSPRKLADRQRFEEGLEEMIRILQPQTVLVYGSANYECFKKLEAQGIKVVSYRSRTDKFFGGGD